MSFARTIDTATPEASVIARLRALLRFPSLIWHNRYTVQNFFRRELMSRFHGSFVGAWWMLVQPVFMFAIYFMVFGVLYSRTGEPNMVDALYLFSGVVLFHALQEATSSSCSVVVANGNLVKKVAFPSEVLPVHISLVSIVLYLVGAIVCLLAGWVTGTFGFGWSLLLLPLCVLQQFLFVLGLGLLLANANVFVRDVQQLWRILSIAWMFLSPVFWQPSLMEGAVGKWAHVLFAVNPAYPLLMTQRYAFSSEWPAEFGIGDFWWNYAIGGAWAVGMLVVGFVTFVGAKHKHSDIV